MAEVISTGSSTVRKLARKLALSEGVYAGTISADATIGLQSPNIIRLNGGAASRNVSFLAACEPAGECSGPYLFHNSGTTDNLVIKSSAAATIATVAHGAWAIVYWSGTAWAATDVSAAAMGSLLATANTWTLLQTFSAGIAADTIAEKTSAAGVTIDGLLIKDTSVGSAASPATAVTATTLVSDTISEKTSAAGVTVDGVLLKDGVNSGTMAAANVFVSTEQTGTGASQNVAHGFGATPKLVWWSFSNIDAGLTAGPPPTVTVVPGAHDATNCVFTVTTGVKFYAFALK